MKIKFNKILRVAICCLVAMVMLAPVEADGARKKRRKATTTATTKQKKKKTSTTGTSTQSRSARRNQLRTVTQATQDAAINASKSRNSSTRNSPSSKGSQSSLSKIVVDTPDLEEIRVATLDPSNKFYFPKLWEKYEKNDTTMSPEEYRYLYLGYMFQEDFDPYRTSPYSDIADGMRDISNASKAEIDTIRRYTERALQDNPFDLRQMSFLVHLLKERKKDMSAKIWEYRLEHLLGAIKSTGTGEDADNAWFVIYPMHEYDIVQLLGYEAVDVEYIEPGIDYLLVQPDGSVKHRNPAKGFYFNVQVPQQQYELKHPEEFEETEET